MRYGLRLEGAGSVRAGVLLGWGAAVRGAAGTAQLAGEAVCVTEAAVSAVEGQLSYVADACC